MKRFSRRRTSIAALFIIMVSSLLFIIGCATTQSGSAARVRDADMKTVQNCQFVGDVHGTSGWGNLAASAGIQNAKNEAREQAATMGASHIIWTGTAGGYSPYVTGKAYNCR